MAYDEALAERVRRAVGPRPDVSERKMFGGLCFLVDGKMFCGIVGDELMVRVGPEAHAAALARPHARPMDFTGRPMTGFVFVAAPGCRDLRSVRAWTARGEAYARTVERAPPRPRRPGTRSALDRPRRRGA